MSADYPAACPLSVPAVGVKRWDAGTKQSSGEDRKMMSSVSGVASTQETKQSRADGDKLKL